jgi:spermidine/putrescine transport system ATP-binding protein
MTVERNVAFGLEMKKVPKKEIETRVIEALEMVHLPDLAQRRPKELSGGQQQRIALARALINRPEVLLLDEPLGALDLKLRKAMQLELKQLQEQVGITFIYVTHDQEEALTMSDRIAIMNEGKIIQLDIPVALYESPASLFVADFIGESNFLKGCVAETADDKTAVETDDGLKVWVKKFNQANPGEEVSVAIRPEKIQILTDVPDASNDIANRFSGRIEEIIYVGEARIYRVSLAAGTIIDVKVQSGPSAQNFKIGGDINIGWRTRHGLALK